MSTTPGAIGYISLSSLDDSVKAIAVKVDDASEAVKCTEETVLDGSYAIQRPFVFATKSDAELSEAAQAFYDFATSEDAAQIYIDAGVVRRPNPLNKTISHYPCTLEGIQKRSETC